jgi:hypothetical protein
MTAEAAGQLSLSGPGPSCSGARTTAAGTRYHTTGLITLRPRTTYNLQLKQLIGLATG